MKQFTQSVRVLFAAVILAGIALPAAAQVAVERVVSPGGIEAWLVVDRSNPIISMDLAFRGGAALDPVDKPGLARMASSTLDEGAGELDSQAFQGRLEDLAISLSFSSSRDSFSGSLRTLTDNRDEAFRLMRLALTVPRFDAEPVERMRRQLTIRYTRNQQDPDYIAGRAFWRTLYPDHPYGRPSQGTAEGYAAITAEDLRGFVRDRLTRDRLMIGVVGDIDAATLGPLLDETFGDLPESGPAARVADVAPGADGSVRLVDRDIPQAVALFGHAGLARDDPDYYAATVMNRIFGGGSFNSRLYQEIREKRGLAYGVYSYLYPLDHSALMLGRVATQSARFAESLALIKDEWARMRDQGATAEELDEAKTYLTGSFPLRFTSTGSVASILVAMQMEDLGIDYLDRRNALIEAVTLEDVNRVAKRLLDPTSLTTVVVGQPSGLENARPAPDGT